MMMRSTVALCLASFLLACAPPEPKVGKVDLVDADGVIDPAEGQVVEVPGAVPKALSGNVRVAIDAKVAYTDVVKALAAVRAAGGTPVVLVIYRNIHLKAMPEWWSQQVGADPIRIVAHHDGRACISPPDNPEATCIQRTDSKHIDRAFVRQLVWKAVREYGLHNVHVVV